MTDYQPKMACLKSSSFLFFICRPEIQRHFAAPAFPFAYCPCFSVSKPECHCDDCGPRPQHLIQKVSQPEHRPDHEIASNSIGIAQVAIVKIASFQDDIFHASSPKAGNPIGDGRQLNPSYLRLWKSLCQGNGKRSPSTSQFVNDGLFRQLRLVKQRNRVVCFRTCGWQRRHTGTPMEKQYRRNECQCDE